MSYRYSEPTQPERDTVPEGEYEFVVVDVKPTYTNEKGSFILPVKLQIRNSKATIYNYCSAGISAKGKPFDMIAPFLKSIRRNPAVDEEPDFSAKNLIGAKGKAQIGVQDYNGADQNIVKYFIYDREKTGATVSRSDAPVKSYNKPAEASTQPDDDNIPW